jgi:hypothetical protein
MIQHSVSQSCCRSFNGHKKVVRYSHREARKDSVDMLQRVDFGPNFCFLALVKVKILSPRFQFERFKFDSQCTLGFLGLYVPRTCSHKCSDPLMHPTS